MDFLKEFDITDDDITYIKSKYSNKMISSIIYKKENIKLLINYFKKFEFNLKTLLINRLDIFLIDIDIVKKKLDSYNKEQIIEILKNDISLFDNLG